MSFRSSGSHHVKIHPFFKDVEYTPQNLTLPLEVKYLDKK